MNEDKIKHAARQAEQFLEAVKQLNQNVWNIPSKESGAVKRASMDLTRALSEMRKPN